MNELMLVMRDATNYVQFSLIDVKSIHISRSYDGVHFVKIATDLVVLSVAFGVVHKGHSLTKTKFFASIRIDQLCEKCLPQSKTKYEIRRNVTRTTIKTAKLYGNEDEWGAATN